MPLQSVSGDSEGRLRFSRAKSVATIETFALGSCSCPEILESMTCDLRRLGPVGPMVSLAAQGAFTAVAVNCCLRCPDFPRLADGRST
jgi:hypothetical protein